MNQLTTAAGDLRGATDTTRARGPEPSEQERPGLDRPEATGTEPTAHTVASAAGSAMGEQERVAVQPPQNEPRVNTSEW